MHAIGDGLCAQIGDGGLRIRVECLDQRGVAQHPARGLAELVAGENGLTLTV